MLELVIITLVNLWFASWLKEQEFYPKRKYYKVLSLIPPMSILYGLILIIIVLIMWLIDTIKEILE
jgi:hypothetical protein